MSIQKLFGFLLITASAIGVIQAQSQDPPHPDELKRRIIERNHNDISDSARWEVKALYPELRLKGDKLAEGFSAAAKTMVMKSVLEFKKNMAKFTKEDREFLPKGVNFYQQIGYSVEHLDDEFVSIHFVQSEYTGGAHPNHWSYTLNYDLKNDKVLNLKDLFKNDTAFLKVISENSISQIAKKQGEYYTVEWVERGAGARLENFASWNMTKKGLKFTFDPYRVGSYAEGSYDTLVPFEKFPPSITSSKFQDVTSISYIDGNPPNWCRNGHFPRESGIFKLAAVNGKRTEQKSRAYFFRDDDDCPNGKNCRGKAYVIPGDRLLVSRKYGDYVCSWYQPEKGDETVGWLLAKNLIVYSPPKKVAYRKWLGKWGDGANWLRFREGKEANSLKVDGLAFWFGSGDNVHTGVVENNGTPSGSILKLGGTEEYDCRVSIQIVGELMIVGDNMMCGGANVTFSGVYRRK